MMMARLCLKPQSRDVAIPAGRVTACVTVLTNQGFEIIPRDCGVNVLTNQGFEIMLLSLPTN